MRSLNVILLLLGALSMLTLGVVPSSAMTGEPPSCHEAARTASSGHEAPAPPGKPAAAMACCIACVVSPVLQAPPRELDAQPARPTAPGPASLPIGLSPAPEHGPPRV